MPAITDSVQMGILKPLPSHARYMTFSLRDKENIALACKQLALIADGERIVVGVGLSLVAVLQQNIPGLRDFPIFKDAKISMPSDRVALWCWLRESDPGQLVHQTRHLIKQLQPAFALIDCVDAFKFDTGRDLTGYEDGTENPVDQAAIDAAIVQHRAVGQNGASFVAVQQWQHQWDAFDSMTKHEQDDAIGRRQSDNEELDDAPLSAHVKRTAQESFTPEAFILRRSMPWALHNQSGLYFVAFGATLDAFEAQLKRMIGLEDGVVDALFRFSLPKTGSYFWCPPMKEGRLDWSLLKLSIC